MLRIASSHLPFGLDPSNRSRLIRAGVPDPMCRYSAPFGGRPPCRYALCAAAGGGQPQGDPIPTRYDFEGQIVFITTDYSFDNFGSGGVAELSYASVRLTNWLPEGTGCSSHGGEGFRPESLLYGT